MSEVVDEVIIEEPVTPRLKTMYKEEVLPELEKEFHHDNPMQVAGLEKIVVSMGVGAAARDSKLIEGAVRDLTAITGQKPKITKAKKSVAQFHLREGQAIGAYVTLRGDRMWEFLDRLLTLALPRIRDFRGINGHQFDGQGNYNFGLTEQSMFHEIDPDEIDHQRGMDITVVTTTKDDDEAYALLKLLGFPFKEN
ncbi:50S ribosomal protein L5 [Bifidobacterium canis]|uniref:Large ribosomal subunit protein uL5 n=1 Tax=Bifidobacterium canis TaxID=2610880 RepID=A0A7K1J5R0_9BIFI|nr:50S ribosomal protein L5 [Bifidobacterium canis]MUH60008.1 50S ribosomal protein L5 [Bifidobacterium canis]